MTLRDHEVIEALRDEPELLALADAFADTQRMPRPRWTRRALPRTFAVAAVAAAVALVVLLAPGGGKNPVLGRALAAIGDGPVLHLVLEMHSDEQLVSLTTGRRSTVTVHVERWTDRNSGREHDVIRIGATTSDLLLPDDLANRGVPTATPSVTDPAFDALWKGYRRALADGEATLERSDMLDGRPVYWLRFPSFRKGLPGTEVAIDRDTYEPVLVRSHSAPGVEVESRVLKAETVPFDASDFKRVGQRFFGDAAPAGSAPPIPRNASDALKAPWLTPGKRVAGLELFLWSIENVPRASGRWIRETELSYGDDVVGPKSLTVDEYEQPDIPGWWRHIPPGYMSIQRGESRDEKRSYPSWTGALVANGIYVRIETGAGEQALFDVAHALHPAP